MERNYVSVTVCITIGPPVSPQQLAGTQNGISGTRCRQMRAFTVSLIVYTGDSDSISFRIYAS